MLATRVSKFGRSIALVSLAAAMLLPAEIASAATPPPTKVDPNSPAGKEYGVPLDTARHDASGSSSHKASSHKASGSSSKASGAGGSSASGGRASATSSAGSDGPAPAFGVGISKRANATGAKGGKSSVNRKGAVPSTLGGAAEGKRLRGSSPAVAHHNASTVAAASSTVGLTGGIIAGVLVAGIAGGLLMRRFGGRGASS